MDVKIINHFLSATVKVLKTMAFINAKPSKPYIKKGELATGDISSIVGLTGEKRGTVSISFEMKCIVKIVSNMLGEELVELKGETADGVGEIANMISGQARKNLEEVGYHFDGAIPSVFSGENHNIIHITDGPIIAIPFSTDFGAFVMEICFDS